jgi:uncharacterized protein YndB with AHSA1/START domain
MDDINRSDVAATVRSFVYSQWFDAPSQWVWRAWMDAHCLARWWPPQGQELCEEFHYHEVLAPKKLVFVAAFSDMARGTNRRFVGTTWPLKVLNTLKLVERDGTTILTLQSLPFSALEAEIRAFDAGRDGLRESVGRSWNRLADYLDEELEAAWAGAATACK